MEVAEKTMFVLYFLCSYVIVVVNGLGCSSGSDTPVIASCKYTTMAPPHLWFLMICMEFNITSAAICKGANCLNGIKKML